MIQLLSEKEILALKEGGKILKDVLSEVLLMVKPGVSTLELDQFAEKRLIEKGSTPTFKNYVVPGLSPYPATLCVSINDEIVHGIPSAERIIKDNDLVSLDIGAKYEGMCTDMAKTIYLGNDPEIVHLLKTTEKALEIGIASVKIGEHIGLIGANISKYVENEGFSVVKDLVGHGIGANPQMDPMVPNYGEHFEGPIIENGLAIAIEPMVTNGSDKIKSSPDGWIYLTKDGSMAAHFEHTLIVENGKAVVVTR